jgi:hypothetical protein
MFRVWEPIEMWRGSTSSTAILTSFFKLTVDICKLTVDIRYYVSMSFWQTFLLLQATSLHNNTWTRSVSYIKLGCTSVSEISSLGYVSRMLDIIDGRHLLHISSKLIYRTSDFRTPDVYLESLELPRMTGTSQLSMDVHMGTRTILRFVEVHLAMQCGSWL